MLVVHRHYTICALFNAEDEGEIDPLDAFMMGNNAAGAVQQQTHVKPYPDSKPPGVPPSRPPLAGGPVLNGKVKRAPVRRGKRSMYDTSSSSEEEEEEEQSDEEDDEVSTIDKPLLLQRLQLLLSALAMMLDAVSPCYALLSVCSIVIRI